MTETDTPRLRENGIRKHVRDCALKVLSDALAASDAADFSRATAIKVMCSDSTVLDAVLVLHATGHSFDSLSAFSLPYRLVEAEWLVLLSHAAVSTLRITLKGVTHEH